MYKNSLSELGVPQRSIIDPILVIIYVNDLCNVSQVDQFILLQMTAR